MALPDFLARPIFNTIYAALRLTSKTKAPRLKRTVRAISDSQRAEFDQLFDAAVSVGAATPIQYNLPYPKIDFLNYLCDWRGFVAHGSPMHDLQTLEPIRKSTDSGEFGNRKQIFGSPDAIWATWFAILDKEKYISTNNGCMRQGQGEGRIKYYYFALPKNKKEDPPFTDGMIYICPAEHFTHRRDIPILNLLNGDIEEWGSTNSIQPLAKLNVSPSDFPFLEHVQFAQ